MNQYYLYCLLPMVFYSHASLSNEVVLDMGEQSFLENNKSESETIIPISIEKTEETILQNGVTPLLPVTMGRTIYVNPETGQLTSERPEGITMEPQQRRKPESIVYEVMPNTIVGGSMIDLRGQILHYQQAHINEKGSLSIEEHQVPLEAVKTDSESKAEE